jgi:hypothetical protein
VIPSGVDVVSRDALNDTVTIRTGDDGRAVVWLRPEFSNSDLNPVDPPSPVGSAGGDDYTTEDDVTPCPVAGTGDSFSGITGFITSDTSARDETCKRFQGVTRFDKASLSGILSDQRDERVPFTFVYMRNMRWDFTTNLVQITPADDQNPRDTTWTVSYYEDDGTPSAGPDDTVGTADPIPSELVNQETGLSFADLQTYDFGTSFPNIDSNGPFKLAEFSGEGDTEFTLKDVPAVPPATGGPTTDYDVRGIALQEEVGGELATGNATASTKPGFTDDANIAFPFIADVEFTVEDGSLSAPETVAEGEPVTVSANVTNDGTTEGSEDIQFRLDANQSGDFDLPGERFAQNTTTTLNVGETREIAFTLPAGTTDGLTGTFTHGVFTINASSGEVRDSETAEIDIVNSTGGSPLDGAAGEADTDGDGALSDAELSDAIGEWALDGYTDAELSEIIQTWATT